MAGWAGIGVVASRCLEGAIVLGGGGVLFFPEFIWSGRAVIVRSSRGSDDGEEGDEDEEGRHNSSIK